MGSPQTDEKFCASPTKNLAKSFGQALGSDWDSKKTISSIFEKETKEAVQARKAKGSVVIDLSLREGRKWDGDTLEKKEKNSDDNTDDNALLEEATQYPLILSHPVRPTRDWKLGKEQLEKGEEDYFAKWCEEVDIQTKLIDAKAALAVKSKETKSIHYHESSDDPLFSDEETTTILSTEVDKKCSSDGKLIIDGVNNTMIRPIHIFERNLDVWRQLWRTLEQSDTILIVADSRNPLMHIPISLIQEVKEIHHLLPKKGVLLVFTKVDLVSKTHIERWTKYLETKYPGYFDGILEFTKQPHKNDEERVEFVRNHGIAARKKRFKTLTAMKKTEVTALVNEYTSKIVSKAEELANNYRIAAVGVEHFQESVRDFPLTLGCIGHPNVGKSSILNAIIGSKKLSVSRTAGHTKHIQHITLTNRKEEHDDDDYGEHLEVNSTTAPAAGEYYPFSPSERSFGGCTATSGAKDSKATTAGGNTNAAGIHVRPTPPNPKRGGGRNARNKKKGGKVNDEDFPSMNQNFPSMNQNLGGDENLSKSERKRMKNDMRTDYKEAQVGFEEDLRAPLAPGTKKKGKNTKKAGGGGNQSTNQSNTSNQPALTASTLCELEKNTEHLNRKIAVQKVDGFELQQGDGSDHDGNVEHTTEMSSTGKATLPTYTPRRGPNSVSGTVPAGSPSSVASHCNVDRVMDCPGLVFPSPHRPLHLSELAGLLPIAQIRETYSAVRYLAERVPLEKYYGLEDELVRGYRDRTGQDTPKHNKGKHDKICQDEYNRVKEQAISTMTPINLLEAFCEKRKMFLAKTGAPDLHRGGLEIIRDCVDGVVVLAVEPPDY